MVRRPAHRLDEVSGHSLGVVASPQCRFRFTVAFRITRNSGVMPCAASRPPSQRRAQTRRAAPARSQMGPRGPPGPLRVSKPLSQRLYPFGGGLPSHLDLSAIDVWGRVLRVLGTQARWGVPMGCHGERPPWGVRD